MKTKLPITFIGASLLLIIFNATRAFAQASPMMQKFDPTAIGEGLFFILVILILIVLALWILKNSNLLDNTADTEEPDGRDWLNKHLKDLRANQLDTLIKRSGALKQNEGDIPVNKKK